MSRVSGMRRIAVLTVLVAVFFASQGCSTMGTPGRTIATYFRHRGDDALEMIDLGFTITNTPQFGFYWNSLDALVFGASEIDGWFVGLGGNQIGVTRHYNKCSGAMVSQEIIGWGDDFDKDDPNTLYMRYGGLLGFASMGGRGHWRSSPDYTPACVHFFPHIGYVGFVWNARWTQIVDFLLGWALIDIAGDDGYQFGKWPAHMRNPRRM